MTRGHAKRWIMFDDQSADTEGRRSFTLFWINTDAVFRPELSKDGQPVGFRRAQCFFCDPSRFSDAEVITREPW